MSTDPALTEAIDTHAAIETARLDALVIGTFVATLRDTSGIDDDEELASMAHHYMDKIYPDADTESEASDEPDVDVDSDARGAS